MVEPRRVMVVTGSRAEYGILQWVMHDIQKDSALELQVVATGMHLAPQFGLTVGQIIADGFAIDAKVDVLMASGTAGGVAKSMGLGLMGMSDAIERLSPDILLVLGDRFEIMAAVQAAMVHGIPVAHIAGGDVTEGAFDEAIRHSITKMAHIHLVTNEISARRVRQMGEDPGRIHVVGSPSLDHLRRTTLLTGPALEKALGASLGARNLLVTFHPVTLDASDGVGQIAALLEALTAFDDATIWFTRPNADPGGVAINGLIDQWAEGRPNVEVRTSLGQLRYLSLMSQVDAVVGNSSSGLYEAPSLGTPTVNVGDRQAGRLAADSVIHVAPERGAIVDGIRRAFEMDCSDVTNPYGDGESSGRILDVLKSIPDSQTLLRKKFFEIEHRED